ncbi:MAG TPA: glycogen debranching N-terminal domain-containing protein [Deinococcales bacterium]|nr:glycogen debranching N-terminal domain-containing protein [Deinococcales bacterium]
MRLKENNLYVVADENGQFTGPDNGLYRRDTRYLKRLEWRVNGETPTVLSTHSPEPYRFSQHLTEPHLAATQRLELRRRGRLDGQRYVETMRARAFDDLSGHATPDGYATDVRQLELKLEADFLDMFEVRGLKPIPREVNAEVRDDGLAFTYQGKDGKARATLVELHPMGEVRGSGARRTVCWTIPQDGLELTLTITPLLDGQPAPASHNQDLTAGYAQFRAGMPVHVANPLVQRVFDQSTNDLRALLFDVPQGVIPAAGIPWFVAPFGRDSLIVSLMTLPWQPSLAEGTLRYLAAHQGTKFDPATREAPGKILHEERVGEATNTGRTPHRPYYGTVDATPLWLGVLGEYVRWTGDLDLARTLEPNLRAALAWMDGPDGDPDGDGLLEYIPHVGGITCMGWKDSGDSVFDAQGHDLTAPIALVEVQGYAYRARLEAAHILRALGDETEAATQETKAKALRERVETLFWLPDLGYYAHALDAAKQPARVLTSNTGQLLWSGLPVPDRARAVSENLFSPELWSGWGVRTIAKGSPRFNFVSYHNGSVWPHDNAMIALGLARYGLNEAAARIATAQLEAAALAPDARLPELFAGYTREQIQGLPDSPPVPYPASCHPQAWAAATPFALLQAVTGFTATTNGRRDTIPSPWGTVSVLVLRRGQLEPVL